MTCYHIWVEASSGNAMIRIPRCFKSRSAAKTTARRGITGDRTDAPYVDRTRKPMVLQCRPDCPCCGPKAGRWECGRRCK